MANTGKTSPRNTPEAIRKRAERAAKKQSDVADSVFAFRNSAGRPVDGLAYNLRMNRSCGVVAMQGAPVKQFFIDVQECFGTDTIVHLAADGPIQGEAPVAEVDELHIAEGLVSFNDNQLGQHSLLIFSGVIFSPNSAKNQKVPETARRLSELLMRHDPDQPMMLFVGDGTRDDLPLTGGYDKVNRPPIVQNLPIVYGLSETGKLSTVMGSIVA
ncbi:MAG: hypothetical protein AAB971_01875 [Patescibacteria group bacterium]